MLKAQAEAAKDSGGVSVASIDGAEVDALVAAAEVLPDGAWTEPNSNAPDSTYCMNRASPQRTNLSSRAGRSI